MLRPITRAGFSTATSGSRAARLNSQPPVWHQFCLFLAAYNSGNFEAAKQVADQLDGQQGPEAYLPVIIMAMRDGNLDRARSAIKKLVEYDATYAGDPAPSLGKIGLFPDVARPVIEALKTAMVEVKA